jgi:hypothetical protein
MSPLLISYLGLLYLIICMDGLAAVEEHMWQLCLAHRESLSLVDQMELDLFSSLCGSTSYKAEVGFGRHRTIATVPVLTSSTVLAPLVACLIFGTRKVSILVVVIP